MCGIVGLHLKTDVLSGRLGALAADMLDCMAERGPDSAGLALYGADALPAGALRCSVRAVESGLDWAGVAEGLAGRAGGRVRVEWQSGDAAALVVEEVGGADGRGGADGGGGGGADGGGGGGVAGEPGAGEGGVAAAVVAGLRELAGVRLVGYGRAVEVFKDVGAPRAIFERFGIRQRGGVRALGHTRMATESAVTTAHSHPFVPAADVSLIHNGSFSNYATVRRKLQRRGVAFDTDNDSEVAARFIAWQMQAGESLEEALRLVQKELDGFFTLLVGTLEGFAVLRDSFACKPAVVAETDDYVAVASEFRALAGLPGIADAATFEPKPEEIYLWQR